MERTTFHYMLRLVVNESQSIMVSTEVALQHG